LHAKLAEHYLAIKCCFRRFGWMYKINILFWTSYGCSRSFILHSSVQFIEWNISGDYFNLSFFFLVQSDTNRNRPGHARNAESSLVRRMSLSRDPTNNSAAFFQCCRFSLQQRCYCKGICVFHVNAAFDAEWKDTFQLRRMESKNDCTSAWPLIAFYFELWAVLTRAVDRELKCQAPAI